MTTNDNEFICRACKAEGFTDPCPWWHGPRERAQDAATRRALDAALLPTFQQLREDK